jgi:glycosyltransferase involved in cell wall biosynthesis
VRVRVWGADGGPGAADDSGHELHEQVTRLGLDETISFLGVLTDPRPVLWAADALILASEREGLPNTLVEGMACGLVCIAPASAAGDEALGKAGIVPPSASTLDLTTALAKARDSGVQSRLRGVARRRAERYSVTVVVDAYEELYRRLAGVSAG